MRIEDYFEFKEKIGEGHFGVVKKCIEKSSGKYRVCHIFRYKIEHFIPTRNKYFPRFVRKLYAKIALTNYHISDMLATSGFHLPLTMALPLSIMKSN